MTNEYYEVSWNTFARKTITTKSIPVKSAMIDSSNYYYQNGSDVYISHIVKDILSLEEISTIAQAHRNMVDFFSEAKAIENINKKITAEASMSNGSISLSANLGTKNAWEHSLLTQVDGIPFGSVGKGTQCAIKTELALSNRRAQKAGIILLEEPESHLSFSHLNQLIMSISQKCTDRQILISTHSSYVANKLGLENLILLNDHRITRLSELVVCP